MNNNIITTFDKAIAVAEDLKTMGQEAMLNLSQYAQLPDEQLSFLLGFTLAKLGNPVDYSRRYVSKTKILEINQAMVKATLFFSFQEGFWLYGVNVSVPQYKWILCTENKGLYDDINLYVNDQKVHGNLHDYIWDIANTKAVN